MNSKTHPITRRNLLATSAALFAATSLAALPDSLRAAISNPASREFTGLDEDQRKDLAAIQQHLFPRGDGPGADEVNATSYFERALLQTNFDAEVVTYLTNGVGWTTEESRTLFEASPQTLSANQMESLFTHLVDNTRWGESWLSSMLTYILEALLADPAYGGNPDQIGWKWLHHQPGFPRPPADKTHNYLLASDEPEISSSRRAV